MMKSFSYRSIRAASQGFLLRSVRSGQDRINKLQLQTQRSLVVAGPTHKAWGHSQALSRISHQHQEHDDGYEEAVWAGRWLGGIVVAAGLAANVANGKADSDQEYLRIENWSGLEGLIAGSVEMQSKQLLSKTKLAQLDPKQLEEAFYAIRKDKNHSNSLSLSDLSLSREEFSMAMSNLGIQNQEVIDHLFDNFDKDGNGKIDYSEWSLAMMALTGRQAKDKLKVMFDFCDINGDGKVTKSELKQSLGALFSVASNLTGGKFLNSEIMREMDLNEEDVKAAIVHRALNEMFPGIRPRKGPEEEISMHQFHEWIQSDSASSRIFAQLFDILGGVMTDKSKLEPARYSGYAFLFGMLGKKVRYLAYSSDFGEALRPVVPPMAVNATYAIAIGYCMVDVGLKTHEESKKENGEVMRTAVHQTIFQAIASIGLPFLLIHTNVRLATNAFKRYAPKHLRYGPTAAGLVLIPFLPMICDHPSEVVIDTVFDQVWPVENKSGSITH